MQYLKWAGGLLQGDLGCSLRDRLPVNEVVGDRLLLTVIVSLATILFTWVVSFPIGVYSATHQYSLGDYCFTFLGYIGLATPSFLLALVLLYFANVYFGISIGGLMDPQYIGQPWSWAKFQSVLAHLWIPVVVIGLPGTAGMIRRLRANLLDELQEAVRRHRPRQGPAAVPAADEVSAAHVAQSLHRRHRQPAAGADLRLGHRVGGDVAAD